MCVVYVQSNYFSRRSLRDKLDYCNRDRVIIDIFSYCFRFPISNSSAHVELFSLCSPHQLLLLKINQKSKRNDIKDLRA